MPLFPGADEALLRRVLALPGVTAEAFPAGEAVYQPHQFRRCLGFLLSGQVQVTNAALSVSVLEAGELFGAAALYNDLPDYATTLTARSPCRILFLPQEDVDRLLGEEHLLRQNYLRYLSGRIRFLSGRLGALAQTGAEGKLARYLLSSGAPSVHAPATDLAKRLGLSRASLYRAFESLETEGLIRREARRCSCWTAGGWKGFCERFLFVRGFRPAGGFLSGCPERNQRGTRGQAQIDFGFASADMTLVPGPPFYGGRQLGSLGGHRKGAGGSADRLPLVFRCR